MALAAVAAVTSGASAENENRAACSYKAILRMVSSYLVCDLNSSNDSFISCCSR